MGGSAEMAHNLAAEALPAAPVDKEDNTKLCPLCQHEPTDPVHLPCRKKLLASTKPGCQASYCRECMERYIQWSISKGEGTKLKVS